MLLFASIFAFVEYRRADTAADLAEQRLASANTVVDRILNEALPELGSVPGTGAVRKQIHGYLEDLQSTLLPAAQDDLPALLNRMTQHRRRGQLALTHDDLELARHECDAGLRLAEQQLARDPTSATARHQVGMFLSDLGRVEIDTGDLDAGRRRFDHALTFLEPLVRDNPQDAGYRSALGAALHDLGLLETLAGNAAAARPHLDRALVLQEALVSEAPDDGLAQLNLSVALIKLGNAKTNAGDQQLVVAQPQDPDYNSHLAESLAKLAIFEKTSGDLARARPYAERAVAIAEQLVAADPHDTSLRHALYSANPQPRRRKPSHCAGTDGDGRRRTQRSPRATRGAPPRIPQRIPR